jgi:hypothetical protein
MPSPFGPNEVRYLVYAELENPEGTSEYHTLLSRDIDAFRTDSVLSFMESIRNPEISQKLFAFLVLDLFDVYQELIDRRVKPYFVEVDE